MLIVSCELIDPFINPPKDDCVLQKTTWSIPDDPAHSSTEYSYDSSGKLIEITSEVYDLDPDPIINGWVISYSNDKVDQINSYWKSYDDPQQTEKDVSFFYDGDLPDSIFYKYGEVYGTNQGYYTANYSGDKLIQLIDYKNL